MTEDLNRFVKLCQNKITQLEPQITQTAVKLKQFYCHQSTISELQSTGYYYIKINKFFSNCSCTNDNLI